MFSTVQRSSLPITIFITNNPSHIHTEYYFNAHFHVIFPSMSSSKRFIRFKYLDK